MIFFIELLLFKADVLNQNKDANGNILNGSTNQFQTTEKSVHVDPSPKQQTLNRSKNIKHYTNAVRYQLKPEFLSKYNKKDFKIRNLREYFNSEKKIHFSIEDVPFAEGAKFYCFKGWINNNKNDIFVCKIAKKNDIDIKNIKLYCLAQSIAKDLASEFSKIFFK